MTDLQIMEFWFTGLLEGYEPSFLIETLDQAQAELEMWDGDLDWEFSFEKAP